MQGQRSGRLREAILNRFLEAGDDFVSGEAISRSLEISRTALWKQIKTLEDIGFVFEAVSRVGYRLKFAPDELIEPLLKRHLDQATHLGQIVFWEQVRLSTNDSALALAKNGAAHGTVVTAGKQVGGRGRHGRVWSSPVGGMWLSILVENPCAVSQAADLTLLASVAVARAIREFGLDVEIKWPNDILYQGKKLCGILAQMRASGEQVEYAVIGIGINANISRTDLPEEVKEKATTILSELGHPVDRPKLLAAILKHLDVLYRALAEGTGGFSTVRDEWKSLAHTLGRVVSVQTGDKQLQGVAIDIDAHGSLHIQDGDTVTPIHSGEILFSADERV